VTFYIQIPNLFSRGVLRATAITLCFDLGEDLHQPASIIVFGCKQAQQYSRTHHLSFIRAVSWRAQNAESHWSHVHITLTEEHFSFHPFYKKYGLQRDLIFCSSR